MCLQFQTGSQVSICVEALNSAFLSSCKRGFRPPVELNWGPGAFLEFATGVSVLPLCCELTLGVPFESVPGNQALSRVDGGNPCLSNYGKTPGFLSSFKLGPASS